MTNSPRIRIGTSNTTVPGNKTTFPPGYRDKSRLHYYSTLFNTVEVNSCFYKTPQKKTYEKWVLDVPDDFQFTLKLSKEVTHAKELESDLTCMESFIDAAVGTGNNKGCLLIQFPGKISLDHFNKVEAILEALHRIDPEFEWRRALELRNDSWYVGETYELLNEHGAALVLHDKSKGRLDSVKTNASFVYQRFHGPAGDYRGSYPDEFIKARAKEMQSWLAEGKDVYAYFNNTAGDAFNNARSLMSNMKNIFAQPNSCIYLQPYGC